MYQPVGIPHQGWFLCYLFFYSQIFTKLFLSVHPHHQKSETKCFKKPFTKFKINQLTCGMCFFGFITPDSDSFVRAVKFWLGTPIKLFFGELIN